MNSTLLCTATDAVAVTPLLDTLVLPAATAAPAALVIAVDTWVSQETSARTQVVAGGTGHVALAELAVAPYAAVSAAAAKPAAMSFRTRNASQVPPPRGTPV